MMILQFSSYLDPLSSFLVAHNFFSMSIFLCIMDISCLLLPTYYWSLWKMVKFYPHARSSTDLGHSRPRPHRDIDTNHTLRSISIENSATDVFVPHKQKYKVET
ncbi:hypothetical protein H2248_010118 [Termitomyces sp. 'cryptogamus']|nr:hypothetical protein H2248_010118 [Termitomyces sp. 'cryptogamus']